MGVMPDFSDYSDLAELAKAATQGKRHMCLGSGDHLMTAVAIYQPEGETQIICDCLTEYMCKMDTTAKDHRSDMKFIAAADPETVLALITQSNHKDAELLRLREMLREGEALLTNFGSQVFNTPQDWYARRAAWLKKAQELL